MERKNGLLRKVWKHRWLLRTMLDGRCPPPTWGIIAPTTNICNLSCPFCKTGNKTMSLPKKMMSLEDFRTIIGKMPAAFHELHMYGWGEPLINPDFPEMVRLAKARGMETYIDTNLALPLSPDRIRDIIESGLDDMTVSCDGVTQATYERYRVGGRVDQVFANIEAFVQVKKSLGRDNPRITWKYLINRWSEPELPQAYEKAKELGVVFNKFGMTIPPERYQAWKSEKFHPDECVECHFPTAICTYLFQSIVIHSDGSVTPCCYMHSHHDIVGNLLQSDFESIWNGPLMRKTRQIFIPVLFPGRRTMPVATCTSCKLYAHWKQALTARFFPAKGT